MIGDYILVGLGALFMLNFIVVLGLVVLLYYRYVDAREERKQEQERMHSEFKKLLDGRLDVVVIEKEEA